MVSACGAEPSSTSSRAALRGGTPDAGDPALAGLLANGALVCAGILVSPKGLLTAAHCVDETAVDSVFFGQNVRDGVVAAIEGVHVHPAYDASTLANDVAAIVLQPAPHPAAPMPFFEIGRLGSQSVGATIRLVGFSSGGTKEQGVASIDVIDDTDFFHLGGSTQTCFGDSGGPAFLNSNGVEQLVGIASGGDAECREFGRHMRLDAYADFISAIFADGPAVSRAVPAASLPGERVPASNDGGCSVSMRESEAPLGESFAWLVCVLVSLTRRPSTKGRAKSGWPIVA